MPSSSGPNSVISDLFQGVCSSATSESVVSTSPATEAPFWRAWRTTRSGSMTPSSTRFAEPALQGVEALVDRHRRDLLDDLVGVVPGVGRDQVHRLGQGGAHDLHARPVVAVDVEVGERRFRMQQGRPAAGDDALGHGGPGGLQCVVHPVADLLGLRVGRRPDLDDGGLARQPRDPLGQEVLVGADGRPLQLGAQLGQPPLAGGRMRRARR